MRRWLCLILKNLLSLVDTCFVTNDNHSVPSPTIQCLEYHGKPQYTLGKRPGIRCRIHTCARRYDEVAGKQMCTSSCGE